MNVDNMEYEARFALGKELHELLERSENGEIGLKDFVRGIQEVANKGFQNLSKIV